MTVAPVPNQNQLAESKDTLKPDNSLICRLLYHDNVEVVLRKSPSCIILVRQPSVNSTKAAKQVGIFIPADRQLKATMFQGDVREKQPCKPLPQYMNIANMLQNKYYTQPFLYLSQEEKKLENFYTNLQTPEVQNWLDKIYPFDPAQRTVAILPGFYRAYDPFDL
jgi:hypothetical protein